MTSVEGAILVWLVIGVGIAGGVFIVARSAVQIASVAYGETNARAVASA